MNNRFFTILVVPEKTSRIRRLVVPSWIIKSSLVAFSLVGVLVVIMMMDYWYVMNQISENRELKLENRRLRQQVQIFRNKMANVEGTLERIETFTTRLKVITNISDKRTLEARIPTLPIPDANANVGQTQRETAQDDSSTTTPATATTSSDGQSVSFLPPQYEVDEALLRKEESELDARFHELNAKTLYVEQDLQDLYELLSDQKAFLAALPTRRPAVGYLTSGFGVRKSPYSGRDKMHEGLDIANFSGTPIVSPANGVITFAGRKPGYGRTVVIDHGYGLETWYAHTRQILVRQGDKINRGEKIALMGSSGYSTGPHVHYEVRVHGIPVDPLSYLLEN